MARESADRASPGRSRNRPVGVGPHAVVVPDARRHVRSGAGVAKREAKLGVGGVLLALPDVLWVNRPDLAATAVYRPVQWATAARCGLTVPRTLVSNDPAAVARFSQVSVPGVVLKPLSTNLIYEDVTYKMGWTRKLSVDDIADLRGIDVTAHLVQDWAPKCWECELSGQVVTSLRAFMTELGLRKPPVTITVPASTWKPLARRLADELDADGDLHTRGWREALLAVPRHELIPRYYLQDRDARPLRWTTHEPHDPQSTQQWLDLVYSPTTLITGLAGYADRGVQAPVSSSTKPDLMIRMLEALDVTDGMRVLEIGTRTGYNAALLAHRLGSAQVRSVDIDPHLVCTGPRAAGPAGLHLDVGHADGVGGLPAHAPFDRIIATCALFAVPAAWIGQLQPGGLALAHIEGPLGAGNLLALRRSDTRRTHGGFITPGPHHPTTSHRSHHGRPGRTRRRSTVSVPHPALPPPRHLPQHLAHRQPRRNHRATSPGRFLVRDHPRAGRDRSLPRA